MQLCRIVHLTDDQACMPCRNASVLTASLLWRDPTSKAMDGSSGSRDSLRSGALSLLKGMAAGLQVTKVASQHRQHSMQGGLASFPGKGMRGKAIVITDLKVQPTFGLSSYAVPYIAFRAASGMRRA